MTLKLVDPSKTGIARYCPTFKRGYDCLVEQVRAKTAVLVSTLSIGFASVREPRLPKQTPASIGPYFDIDLIPNFEKVDFSDLHSDDNQIKFKNDPLKTLSFSLPPKNNPIIMKIKSHYPIFKKPIISMNNPINPIISLINSQEGNMFIFKKPFFPAKSVSEALASLFSGESISFYMDKLQLSGHIAKMSVPELENLKAEILVRAEDLDRSATSREIKQMAAELIIQIQERLNALTVVEINLPEQVTVPDSAVSGIYRIA